MGKSLIIVESPAKVKTIKKFLGPAYTVQASVGHIRDLPTKTIGVDEAHDFAPQYEIIQGKEKVVNALRDAAAKADTVYLAPDPDREGEAIAWHVAEILRDVNSHIKRIQFNEITAKAVKEALAHPRDLNVNLFDAQQARRVLDRLVGYKISPLLWKKVKRGISAGRVQSVALRLIVEREEERNAFTPEEYWLFKAVLEASTPPPFKVDLWKVEGKKPKIPDAAAAEALEGAMRGKPFVVSSVEEKERQRAPQPPFITSTLQQAANQRMGYPAKRTMNIAQRLYEGVELGERGTTALITYMRTDSVRLSDEAVNAAIEFINGKFGKDHLAPGGKGRQFKGKGGAQDAHEAIRPVDVSITPDEIKPFVAPDQYQVYRLIWSRFVASQMAPAKFHDTTVIVDCGPAQWRARGERLLFPGFLAVMPRAKDDADDAVDLPELKKGDTLTCKSQTKEQKFTQPPARYSEASLVRELEEQGIGRPSTYAAIISTLQDRDYVRLQEKNFVPTDLGRVVCDHLRTHFKDLMDVGFTAEMENKLDKVAEGGQNWVALLKDFTHDFDPTLASASAAMNAVKTGMATDAICPECGKPLVIKFGKAGQFLACSGYPECRYTSDYSRDEKGEITITERVKPELEKVGECPKCKSDLVIRKSRTGSRFIACTGYPDCDYAAPFSTGVPCPRCSGSLVEKSAKRGKVFYSCSEYPKCDYATWDWPIAEACPQCGSAVLVEKTTKARGKHIACPEKTCRYSRDIEPQEEE